jgi:hypothetical protein
VVLVEAVVEVDEGEVLLPHAAAETKSIPNATGIKRYRFIMVSSFVQIPRSDRAKVPTGGLRL